MRVLMVTPGTRGDVAPAAGLGARLRAHGHQVAIAANAPYAPIVRAAGCEFRELPGDMRHLANSAPTDADAPARGMRDYLRELGDYMEQAATGTSAAARAGTDLVLVNSVAPFGCDVAEGLGVPSAGIFLQPMEPSAAYPPMLLGLSRGLGRWGNRIAGAALRAAPAPYDSACARLRREWGLPKESRQAAERRRAREGWPVHHGISPTVLPRPKDWRDGLILAGYWWPVPSSEWRPPPALVDFLQAGPPPVFVGFGSTGTRDADLVRCAVRRAGLRGVVQGEVDVAGDDILSIGEAPHDWLFPRMAAVVHHAGAGTAAAGLRAGVPAVTVPAYTDQRFWARRITELGAGPAPIPHRRLTVDRLAAALGEAVANPAYRERARAVARRLADEDGAAPVLAWLDDVQARRL
ncbi:glycosyltransferase [Micromonospora sp. NPDC047670]|uniref:glycosyltransferase n=1 Tax=Micromonospora sp. NPDC047670 TaxID=3364252 RepID=UPI0037179A07